MAGDALASTSVEWKNDGVAGRTSSPGASVTSRALALVGAFDEHH